MKGAAWIIAGLLLTACGEQQSAPPQALTPGGGQLETVAAVSERVARETRFDGAVEAINQSTVSAQTSARVTDLPFDVGDVVEKGRIIVRLRDTEQRARASSATASLAEADARLTEAQQSFERARDIYGRRLIPKAQFDTAAADLKSAQARVEAARAALREAEEGAANTIVRAPYSGIVVKRHVKLGETVTVGTPLMTGLSLEHLRVSVDIPQQHIGELRKHHKARVLLPDGRSVAAAELRIPPAADPDTHTFRVLVTLPQSDHGVFPGTLVKVAFVSGEQEQLLAPAGAVVQRGEVTGAYVVDDQGLISFRYLRAGSTRADGRISVLSGLQAGERLAVNPVAAAAAYKTQGGAAL